MSRALAAEGKLREVWAWSMYDFANSGYTTVVITAVFGASMMLVQNDIKKTLGLSTIGQMGYMIMECGLGAFSLAVFHLIAHGLFKATMFLNSGNVTIKGPIAVSDNRTTAGRALNNRVEVIILY